MIGRGEVTKAANGFGVDAQTVERDYVLAHVAHQIARVGGEHLVLKGGTCLRLAHFEQYRFSADLDYSLNAIDVGRALDVIDAAVTNTQQQTGMTALHLDRSSESLRIEYVGPLGAKPRRIKLDLADDELLIEHADLPLVVAWRDLPAEALVHGYTLTEVCAEKLRCIIQRRQCRDVYDLWSLLENRSSVDLLDAWHRFERKAEHRGLRSLDFFGRWTNGSDWYRQRWDRELADYLGEDCPEFASVARAIDRNVAQLVDYLGR